MFQVLCGSLSGFPGLRIAQAASRAGQIGCVALDYATPDDARKLLDTMVLSGVEFTVSLLRLTPELLDVLTDYAGRGLTRVVLSDAVIPELPMDLAALKRLGLSPVVEVRSLEEAEAAQSAGADALIVKGNESGGLVGEETTFILLQRVVPNISIPVFARGGMGLHTAVAAVIAGASGIVLDWQLALCEESDLPVEVKARVARMDGSETALLGQSCGMRYRAFARPGEAAYAELKELEDTRLHAESDAAEIQEWKAAVELRTQQNRLLLIGQDAAFAGRLAAEHQTVSGICRAIHAAAFHHLRLAREQKAIREESPFAEAHGTRYPIFQGPMTRVSDRAAFALAVADGGGLPFLALALMRGPQVRPLLEETHQQLGDRPWGVGILGFVPKELRDEQLAEVLKVRPPFAIIAGGRPDQAQALEKEGIRTYLHLPSPELLRMFLESGARRVIFEGRECGGHVGPRSSFVLWELMIETILTHLAGSRDRAADYHVVFAGGIHDGLSAAMVSALAAPLAEKGVRIGVLLGTGYLFTREAVSSGAIVEGFQGEALACRETILLESGVGHATRCAGTPFGEQFDREKRRLIKEGRSKEEIREALEMLNLGRLRIASKGIGRDTSNPDGTPAYVQVDDESQRREGMYMIGQVAALRHEVCTIADLHHGVSRAADHLDVAAAKVVDSRRASASSGASAARPATDVAIIGIACVLPKAQDLTSFWQNIVNKVNAIEEVPKDRWDVDVYFDADRRAPDKIYSRWGGFLGPVAFDPARFGMPPNSVPSVDPLQLLMLELSSRALEDAGYANRPFDREHTAVIVGAGGGVGELGLGYGFRSLLPYYMTQAGGTVEDASDLTRDLAHRLPTWTEDSFAGLLLNVIAGRVSNRLDLGGPNYTVDAACASSLAAVRLGISELESRSSNLAIVAGADTMQSPFGYMCFSKTQALSPTGQCRTFDETGDGIVISEGVAVAVLKRLEDATRDGDRVYAVIKGIGASSDGKDKGMTAPRPAGQIRALERAYEKAEVAPDTVGLLEAHGTGTVVGDRTEVESLTTFFSGAGAETQSCALGSVKSLIGHTKCTAGIAGLVKTALALHHKVLPPTGGVTKPNSKANFVQSPVYVNTEARPWLARLDGAPRRAGVSAFGFGGTNFHAVLEEAAPNGSPASPTQVLRDWPAELFLWKGDSPDAILGALGLLASSLANGAQPRLADLAAAVCREHDKATGPHCLAIVAGSLEDLRSKIEAAGAAVRKRDSFFRDPRGIYYSAEPLAAGKVGFLFPGQGSQRPNMLLDLSIAFPFIRDVFERADASLGHSLKKPLSAFIFPPPTFTEEAKNATDTALKQTNVAQPAVGAADLAMYRLLSSLGIQPDMAAGHSYGEFAALCAAGSIPFDDLMRISEARGRFILEAATGELGTMAAVDADESVVAPVVKGIAGVVIANLNSPQQTVISGTEQGIAEALQRFATRNISCRRFPVSCAFHSNLVAGAQEPLGRLLEKTSVRPAVIPVYSNTTAAPHSKDPGAIRRQLAEHLVRPVRFADEVLAMYEAGARVFIEVGPGKVLTGLVEQTLGERRFLAVAMDQPGRHGLASLAHSLGLLATGGVTFHASQLFEGRVERRLELGRLVEQTQPVPHSATSWIISAGRALPANGNGVKPAPVQTSRQIRAAVASSSTDRALNALATESQPPKAAADVAKAAPVMAAPARVASPNAPPVKAAPAPAVVGASPRERTPDVRPIADARPSTSGNRTIQQTAPEIRDSVLQGHHRLMTRFLETHKNVMLAFLNGHDTTAAVDTVPVQPAVRQEYLQQAAVRPPETAAMDISVERFTEIEQPASPALEPEASVVVSRQPEPTVTASVTHPAAAAQTNAKPKVTIELVIARLVAVVSDRTGYPAEMLNVDLDLEADLGVDSIKRVEILGALQNDPSVSIEALGSEIETLSKLKTLRAIAEWIAGRAAGEQSSKPESSRDEHAVGVTAVVGAQPDTKLPVTPELVIARLVAVVSDRTGYPAEMLDVDLDLEADLGVDSIKRVEILGALQNDSSVSLGTLGAEIEHLSKLKTLRAIAEWIVGHVTQGSSTEKPAAQAAAPEPAAKASPSLTASISSMELPVSRLSVELVEAPLANETVAPPVSGLVLITNDGDVADLLAEKLTERGVACHVIDGLSSLADPKALAEVVEEIRRDRGPVAALVHLAPLVDSRSLDLTMWPDRLKLELNGLFNLARALEGDLRQNGSGRVIVGTRMGGSFASGSTSREVDDFWPGNGAVCGLVKTLVREWPEVSCKVADFESDAAAEAIARALLSELTTWKGTTEVGYKNGGRWTLRPVSAPLRDGNPHIALDQQSVVMITGGARGITASVALELARNFRCTLILVGRSAFPAGPESPSTAGVSDIRQLKMTLLKEAANAGQPATPASVETAYKRLLNERETRSNVAAMLEAGSTVEYQPVDVTDAAAFKALIEQAYIRHGRIDGVIHGAGIIEDKLIHDKTPESFDRVIKPKVIGALTLVEALRPESLRFLVFFSSVSARYGNQGQGDYAAANEVLNKLATWLNQRWPGRVVSMNWGPWKSERGMVSDALAAQFAKAGVQLIEPAVGQQIFVQELLFGRKDDAEVIWGGPMRRANEAARVAGPIQRVRLTAPFPMLSGGTEFQHGADDSFIVVRETSGVTDPYLEDHRLDGKPVMPMAMVLELFAEIAASSYGKRPGTIRNLEVLRGLSFVNGSPRQLRVLGAFSPNGHHPVLALKVETGEPGQHLHYTAQVEFPADQVRDDSTPALRLVKAQQLPFPVSEAYDRWLFHGPSFAGIEQVEGIGENGIVAVLKPSAPRSMLSHAPSEDWLVDPVVVDSGLQLVILWTRHYLDMTPLPSRLGTCHVLAAPAPGAIRCEVEVRHQTGSPTLLTELTFFDTDNRLFLKLEEMQFTCSRALNRLSGVQVATGGLRT